MVSVSINREFIRMSTKLQCLCWNQKSLWTKYSHDLARTTLSSLVELSTLLICRAMPCWTGNDPHRSSSDLTESTMTLWMQTTTEFMCPTNTAVKLSIYSMMIPNQQWSKSIVPQLRIVRSRLQPSLERQRVKSKWAGITIRVKTL